MAALRPHLDQQAAVRCWRQDAQSTRLGHAFMLGADAAEADPQAPARTSGDAGAVGRPVAVQRRGRAVDGQPGLAMKVPHSPVVALLRKGRGRVRRGAVCGQEFGQAQAMSEDMLKDGGTGRSCLFMSI